MLNRCQSISTIISSMTSRRLSATAGSGSKEDHHTRPRWESGSERCGFTLEDFLQGEQVIEAPLLASGSCCSVDVNPTSRFRAIARVESCLIVNQGCASGCAFMMKANGRSKLH